MIEKTIIDVLKADSTLTNYLSLYDHSAAIFSEDAPEKAIEPYITIYVERNGNPESPLILQEMDLYIDIWDSSPSRKAVREASERVEFLLSGNNKIDTDPRYDSIRIWFQSGGPIQETDPRRIRYNQLFYIKASRKKFIQQL